MILIKPAKGPPNIIISRSSGIISYDRSDLSELLKIILESGHAVGMDITILNPDLDVDGSITRRFVSSVVSGLS
jgi:hypothetical protein